MHGEKITDKLKGILLSADTIRRRISKIDLDVECQLNDTVKRGKFALQINDSSGIYIMGSLKIHYVRLAIEKMHR